MDTTMVYCASDSKKRPMILVMGGWRVMVIDWNGIIREEVQIGMDDWGTICRTLINDYKRKKNSEGSDKDHETSFISSM